jgi:hypothetical protein
MNILKKMNYSSDCSGNSKIFGIDVANISLLWFDFLKLSYASEQVVIV